MSALLLYHTAGYVKERGNTLIMEVAVRTFVKKDEGGRMKDEKRARIRSD